MSFPAKYKANWMNSNAPLFAPAEELSQHCQRLGLPHYLRVTDSNVFSLWASSVGSTVAALADKDRFVEGTVRFENGWIIVPAGEQTKRLEVLQDLWTAFSRLAIDRSWAIVAVGGGVVGDLAGFAAASYLRGLKLIQVPTTLLAMVDSSLGGKVGIDLPSGKNLVGSFWPASLTLTDTHLLDSLPQSEWSGGMAEIIKHSLLDSQEHFDQICQLQPSEFKSNPRDIVEKSANIKVWHVTEDPFEKGVRAHLNFGHTLAHAIETACGYQGISHGQAVALGMIAAVRLSKELNLLQTDLEPALTQVLELWDLPTQLSQLGLDLDWAKIAQAVLRDKKNRDGVVRFVLIDRPGQVKLTPVALDKIERIYHTL